MLKLNNKIVVILGTTASGKTKLGVDLAYKFNGEIVSADSRQVYRGMDVGTGKDLKDYRLKFLISNSQFLNKSQISNHKFQKYKVVNIPYHLIDVVSPKTEFNLAKYQKLANEAIDNILKQSKLPIIAGGTGLYLQAVVDNYNLSKAGPDKRLREKLEKINTDQLFKELQKLNSAFANKLHESDKKNKRRLIRYIEVCGKAKAAERLVRRSAASYDFLLLGLTWPRQVLRERIYKRLIKRLAREDMIGEVERLHKRGVSWKRLKGFGLEYKYIALYLQGELNYDEMVGKLNTAIRQFAKKQMTWFRRWEKQGAKICWLKDEKEAERLVKKFINFKKGSLKDQPFKVINSF